MVTDANGNRAPFHFQPVGICHSAVVMGKEGEQGDTLEGPSVRMEYDFSRLRAIAAAAGLRPQHRPRASRHGDRCAAAGAGRDDRDRSSIPTASADCCKPERRPRTCCSAIQFSAAVSCRPISPSRTGKPSAAHEQPADPPNVIVSGWQVYDNKGRVVEKYEPFFSQGWDYRRRRATPSWAKRPRCSTTRAAR